MNTKEILIKMKAQIEKGWTKRVCARNSTGGAVDPNSRHACQWCLLGALDKVGTDASVPHSGLLAVQEKLAQQAKMYVSEFNDTHTHSQVLQLLDKAIQNAD